MIALILALALTPSGQHDQHPPAASPPATLMSGLGRLHHPIATKNAEAQKFFDQGLTLVYGFNHDEAIRAFRRAAELDPLSPMPHWGIALALGPNINDTEPDVDREKAAYDEAQHAKMLAATAPARERAYVDALVLRYSNDSKADLKAMAVQYKNAMRDLSKHYPADLDARALYAESLMNLNPWQLWAKDGTPAEGTLEIVSVLEGVLRKNPLHVGANHYYIHAVEASSSANRALMSAKRLETLVPAAGHLVHMPAHIYMRTGNYQGAVTSNARAAKVDRDYIAATKAGGMYPAMYYNHNLDFLASAAMMSGQYDEAVKTADELVRNATPMLPEMSMLAPFVAKKLFVLLRFSRWTDVLALPAADPSYPILNTLSHFGRGVAHAALGHAQEAEAERADYLDARKTIAAESGWGFNKAADIVRITDAVLDARIAQAKHDAAAAIAAWRQAVAAEDALNYDEPPDWFYPVRESLGAALIGAGELDGAERVFSDDLKRNPKNPRSLFGRWQALVMGRKGAAAAAAAARKAFNEAWKHADVELRLADF